MFLMPMSAVGFGAFSADTGYIIEGSGSFNGTDGKLTRTISDAGNRRTFILEVIFKRGGSASSFLTAFSSGSDTFYWYLSSDQVYIQNYESSTQMELKSDAKLRDFSAWYHLIVAIDTTQSTEANRVKAWVNGVELTWASSPRTYPAQDLELKWNTGSQEHQIGFSSTTYSYDYFARAASYDGATMTDPVTDGFGEYDDNGVWVIKNPSDLSSLTGQVLIPQNTGSTIGTMTVRTANAFDGNNNQADGACATHSSALSTATIGKDFGSGNAKAVNQVKVWGYNGGGFTSNASQTCTITVKASNSGLGVSEVTLHSSGTISDTTDANAQDFTFSNSTAYRYVWIELTQGVSNYFFVAELEFYNEETVGFGTTGFLIEDGAAFTNGTDSSGNSENFTKGGTITNVNDTLTDKASDDFGNYATMNPLDLASSTALSNGNLRCTSSSNFFDNNYAFSTIAMSTGKFYVTSLPSDTGKYLGIANASVTTDIATANDVHIYWDSSAPRMVYWNGSNNNLTPSPTEVRGTDQLGIALNATNGDYWIGWYDISGSAWYWYNSSAGNWTGNPDSDSGKSGTLSGGPYRFMAGCNASGTHDIDFGQGALWDNITELTTYKQLNTANLAAPTVTKPSDFYKAVNFSGTGSAQNIDTVGFSPDLLIIKSRTSTANFNWIDRVRGEANILWSNAAIAQSAESTSVTGFRDEGFSVGSDSGSYVNISGQTMIAYALKAGGSGSSNSDGDITSTVSVASHGGFSIVKYDPGSGGSAGDTVGHGLSRAPNYIILKVLESVGDKNWSVGSDDIGWTNNLFLNLTNAKSAGSGPWNNTAPTSSVFSIGSDRDNDAAYIAYCFAKTSGLIACGTYTGNGSADGPFVQVNDGGSGFKPSFIMIKRTDSTEGWHINDAVRDPINPLNNQLQPNSSNAESGSSYMDFTANGFKLRGTQGATNASGGTYVYLAFAENPFGGDGVAQAKAR